ncbi:hypothetical protein [Bacillus massilinigeriensis]|uniref:hypothetical protein n=1 Tax=Bacillus mediterraneensis TaxID=1805474 RepID=UPI0008F8EFB0|nr:hypothetical protein [Bacillus mediterraneensis]
MGGWNAVRFSVEELMYYFFEKGMLEQGLGFKQNYLVTGSVKKNLRCGLLTRKRSTVLPQGKRPFVYMIIILLKGRRKT